MKKDTLLSISQAAEVLQISENTLNALAYSGQIPHIMTRNACGNNALYFNSAELVNWFNNLTPLTELSNKSAVEKLKQRVKKRPGNLSILRKFDSQFTQKRKTKGYSLQKVPNKKIENVYYVRYIDKGVVLPRRSTHTNNYDLAVEYAVKMRETLIKEYYQKREKRPTCRLLNIMRKFYKKDSSYQKTDTRSKPVSEETLLNYYRAVNAHWIPFLKNKRITELDDITSSVIIDYQNYCSKKGLSAQSVNFNVSILNRIFDYLIFNKYIDKNPIKGVPALYVDTEKMVAVRGCYNVNELYGVFNKHWVDEIYYLLCLLTYSTGMRNGEIARIKVNDIIKIKNSWFINIPKSKSKYGIRIVPIHNFVYNKLRAFIVKNNRGDDDLIFRQRRGRKIPVFWFANANIALGGHVSRDEAKLREENITFYSGRHWWKTLMNANALGDVEEYFMGHKVSSDVAKRYNHRDKQGQAVIVKKANEVFKILDKALFKKQKKKVIEKAAAKSGAGGLTGKNAA